MNHLTAGGFPAINAAHRAFQQDFWLRAAAAGRPIDPATGLPRVSASELSAGHLTGESWPAETFSGRGYLPQERNVYTGAPFYGFGVGARPETDLGYNPAAIAAANLSEVVKAAEAGPGWGTYAGYVAVNMVLFAFLAHIIRQRLRGNTAVPRFVDQPWGVLALGAGFGLINAVGQRTLAKMFYDNERVQRAISAQLFLNSAEGVQAVAAAQAAREQQA